MWELLEQGLGKGCPRAGGPGDHTVSQPLGPPMPLFALSGEPGLQWADPICSSFSSSSQGSPPLPLPPSSSCFPLLSPLLVCWQGQVQGSGLLLVLDPLLHPTQENVRPILIS